ncbi:MAG: DUF3365 domain-containing protein [Bacteroidales bacterium]|nr:DUF3365 domain-containing protein [Bacteroidales bacterium]
MKKIIIPVFLTASVLISCNQSVTEKNNQNDESKKPIVENISEDSLQKGFRLLVSNCFSCHSPDLDIQKKIAPAMGTIKKHYITEGITKKDFTENLIEFIKNPVEEKTKIPDAIEKFGVMPKFEFNETDLTNIANYIYHTKLENTDWFAKHFEKEKIKYGVGLKDLPYIDMGKQFVLSTKSVLGTNLKFAIKNKGTANAVEFCQERAYPLTDSMAVALSVKIKRVSDKPRNLLNTANKSELQYILASQKSLSEKEIIKPQIQKIGEKIVGYYPIITGKFCLQCHGIPDVQINSGVLEKIDLLYPKDMATGYAENQLRGIWVVEMDEK